jgi:hypothetical protein
MESAPERFAASPQSRVRGRFPSVASGSMESFREQRCPTCLVVFWICRSCDRGHVYCGEDCRDVGRREQVGIAKQKYLADEDVREGERERLRAYPPRTGSCSQKVVFTGSVPAARDRGAYRPRSLTVA